MKTLTMLGAAVVAAGLVPFEALAAPETTLPAPPAPGATPAPPAAPAPAAVPAPPSESYSTDDAIRRARAASSAAASAAAEAGRVAGEAGRAAGDAGRVEAQLEEARHRLAADAAEVAQLSMQVSGPLMERFQARFDTAPHALIGVELSAENRSDGARVIHVSPGGPAFEAGIRAGDVIVAVNGTDAKGEGGVNRIVRAIHEAAPKEKLSIRVIHEGKVKNLIVTAREMPNVVYSTTDVPLLPGPPANSPVFTYRELGIPSLSNMQLMTLSPGLGRYFGTDKGVLVVRAPTRSDFKLQDGDVILSIDGREPSSGAHATRILASYQAGEKLTLHIMRDRKPLNLETTLPEQKWSYGEFQAPRPRGPNE